VTIPSGTGGPLVGHVLQYVASPPATAPRPSPSSAATHSSSPNPRARTDSSAPPHHGEPATYKQRRVGDRRRGAIILPVTRRNLHCMALDVRYPPICALFRSARWRFIVGRIVIMRGREPSGAGEGFPHICGGRGRGGWLRRHGERWGFRGCRVLMDPNLVEQGPVYRGFLVVPDPGGDKYRVG